MPRRDTDVHERALVALSAGAALVLGAFAALGSTEWHTFIGIVLVIFIAALTAPLSWLALILAALVPLQFYLALPESSFTLRAAFVFALAAAVRVISRASPSLLTRRVREGWLLPAALFLLATFVAALGAQNKYLAFRGIYDWLAVFVTAFVVGEVAQSARALQRLSAVLIAAGVGEAVLGLAQSTLGVNMVVEVLRLRVSALFFQPNLLREKLGDLSFNWIVSDRVVPFGTFINAIDYAVFLAAILSLTLAYLLASREPRHILSLRAERSNPPSQPSPARGGGQGGGRDCFASFLATAKNAPRNDRRLSSYNSLGLSGCALVIGAALLLTFKGSGWLALAGGSITLALLGAPRISARTAILALAVVLVALVVALPFADLLAQRAAFLVQREQGAFGTAGRLDIWMNLLQSFAQRPLFGYGLNHAILLTEPMRTLRGGTVAFNLTAPESAYVAALIETGAVGFIALSAFFATVLARAYRHARQANGLRIGVMAAIVALLCGNLTVAGFTTDQNGMLLGVLIGMVFARHD